MIVQLPGTKVEVDNINKLLKTSGFQVAELTQREATETNLKSARKASILHLATHGYFLKDVEKASWPIGVHADYAKDNVLLRSGLMLTGAGEANSAAQTLDSSNNGIMTSYEAMNLDLKGNRSGRSESRGGCLWFTTCLPGCGCRSHYHEFVES